MGGILPAIGLVFGLLTQGFGYVEQGVNTVAQAPEKLCHVMGGEFDGYSFVGGTKEGVVKAKVPYCTAGPSTLVEGLLKDKGVIN